MKKKIAFLALLIPVFFACSNGGGNSSLNAGYDGRIFDISEAQDGSLTAQSIKDGFNYKLKITGAGEAIDYDKKESVPWNPIIKKITSVTIEEGICNIGDYYFYSLPLDYFILPSTVTSIEEHSFSSVSKLYTYGGELNGVENEVYYYSEDKPSENGKYFYLLDGVPHVWDLTSVLFVGNSFTFYPQKTSNPAVPEYFQKIASSLKQGTTIDYVVNGSWSLTKFSDPSDEYGKVLEEKLTTNQYDYIILQEQSTTPINNYNNFLNGIKKIKARVGQTQDDCEVVLYETWGSPTAIEGKYSSVGEMEIKLRDAYKKAGEETDCKVHYVGKAFTYVYENIPDINIYYSDNRHQGEYGAYLSAAVHVKGIFDIDVTQSTEYCGLDVEKCKTLLGVANTNG